MSHEPMTAVLANKYARSWPLHADGAPAYLLPLSKALLRPYRTDAHFTQYVHVKRRRLGSDAVIENSPVVLQIVAFDVDCEDVHGTGKPVPPTWRAAMREQVAALAAVYPSPFFYETRGGARIVYRLHTPTVLRSPADALEWRRQYAIALAYLARCFSIKADRACADWTRLFRCPRATREGSAQPENLLILRDPSCLGELRIAATSEDVQVAASSAKASTRRTDCPFEPLITDGCGLLFHLLVARGHVIKPHRSNAYVIRCPREHLHSCGRTGDGSTLLYPPAQFGGIGAIHCLHSHCAGLPSRAWLSAFLPSEIEVARRLSGIARSA